MSQPLKNLMRSATDPLKVGPSAGRELTARFGKTANGFSREHVLDATASVMLDLIRQTQTNRTDAHAKLTEFADKMHVLLDQHYNPATGKRRSVFAFDQTIEMNFIEGTK